MKCGKEGDTTAVSGTCWPLAYCNAATSKCELRKCIPSSVGCSDARTVGNCGNLGEGFVSVVKDCSASNQFCSQGSCSDEAEDYVARYADMTFSSMYTISLSANEYTVHADRLLTEVAVHIGPPGASYVGQGYFGVYEMGASPNPTQMAYGPTASTSTDADGYVSSPPINLLLQTGHKYEVAFSIEVGEYPGRQQPTYADAVAPQDISFGQAIGGAAEGSAVAWFDESMITTRLITQRLRTAPP